MVGVVCGGSVRSELSRIGDEGDEEKACSEFWSSSVSKLQSRGPRSCPCCTRAEVDVVGVDKDSRHVVLDLDALSMKRAMESVELVNV